MTETILRPDSASIRVITTMCRHSRYCEKKTKRPKADRNNNLGSSFVSVALAGVNARVHNIIL